MSTVDLMLLGALMQKPLSAYEIKKDMEFKQIKDWIKISTPSIYKNLVKLYKEGYLDGKVVREGEMPEKTVYTINDKGRKYFMKLMNNYSGNPCMVYVDFAAFISNLNDVEPEVGLQMIKNLEDGLQSKMVSIENEISKRKNKGSRNALSIIEMYYGMFQYFYKWAKDFENNFKKYS